MGRHIITKFNASGFDSLRPRTFDDEIRLEIVNIALGLTPKLVGNAVSTLTKNNQ